MTKEELKLEAIRYLENFKDCANCKNRWGDCADQLDEYCLINGCCFATPKEQDIYLAGAEPREKQIAELEDKLANVDYQLEGRDIKIKDLEKENAELKESNKMLEQGYVWHDYDAGEDCYEDTHEGRWVKRDEVYQLTNAKEIIKRFSEFVNNGIEYDPEHPQEHTDLWNKLCEEAKQFLNSEVEK